MELMHGRSTSKLLVKRGPSVFIQVSQVQNYVLGIYVGIQYNEYDDVFTEK